MDLGIKIAQERHLLTFPLAHINFSITAVLLRIELAKDIVIFSDISKSFIKKVLLTVIFSSRWLETL